MDKKLILIITTALALAACDASSPSSSDSGSIDSERSADSQVGASVQNDAGSFSREAGSSSLDTLTPDNKVSMPNPSDASILDTIMGGGVAPPVLDGGSPPPAPADSGASTPAPDTAPPVADAKPLTGRQYLKAKGIVPGGVFFFDKDNVLCVVRAYANDKKFAIMINASGQCVLQRVIKFLNGQTVDVGEHPVPARFATKEELDAAVRSGYQFPPPETYNGLYVVIDEWSSPIQATTIEASAMVNCRR